MRNAHLTPDGFLIGYTWYDESKANLQLYKDGAVWYSTNVLHDNASLGVTADSQ